MYSSTGDFESSVISEFLRRAVSSDMEVEFRPEELK